jgi:hypothetical protein
LPTGTWDAHLGALHGRVGYRSTHGGTISTVGAKGERGRERGGLAGQPPQPDLCLCSVHPTRGCYSSRRARTGGWGASVWCCVICMSDSLPGCRTMLTARSVAAGVRTDGRRASRQASGARAIAPPRAISLGARNETGCAKRVWCWEGCGQARDGSESHRAGGRGRTGLTSALAWSLDPESGLGVTSRNNEQI